MAGRFGFYIAQGVTVKVHNYTLSSYPVTLSYSGTGYQQTPDTTNQTSATNRRVYFATTSGGTTPDFSFDTNYGYPVTITTYYGTTARDLTEISSWTINSASSTWSNLYINHVADRSGIDNSNNIYIDIEPTYTPPTTKYTITTSVSPTGSGSVRGGGTYASGTTVSLTATATTGYKFNYWTKNGARVPSTDNPLSITVTANATYVAYFTKQFKLSFDSQGGSSVSPKYGFEGDTTSMPTCSKSDSSTYYAVYDTYTVSYSTHGGSTCYDDTSDINHKYHDSYSLAYWAVGATHYRSGATYTFPAADKTAVASWSTTVHDDGYYNQTRIMLPSTTRSGYTFLGWYTAASGGTRVGGAGSAYYPNSSITLHAQWKSDIEYVYNLTFDASPAYYYDQYGSLVNTKVTSKINATGYDESFSILYPDDYGSKSISDLLGFKDKTTGELYTNKDTYLLSMPYGSTTVSKTLYAEWWENIPTFNWSNQLRPGKVVSDNLTANDWNKIVDILDALHPYFQLSYTLHKANPTEDVLAESLTKANFNEIRNVIYYMLRYINNHGGSVDDTICDKVYKEDVIVADYFDSWSDESHPYNNESLYAALNRVVDYVNTHHGV